MHCCLNTWGKGYAAEAISAVTDFGFEQLQLQRIDAEVRPANAASVKVLLRAGFKHEGLLRRWMFFNGAHYDIEMYALLAGEQS